MAHGVSTRTTRESTSPNPATHPAVPQISRLWGFGRCRGVEKWTMSGKERWQEVGGPVEAVGETS